VELAVKSENLNREICQSRAFAVGAILAIAACGGRTPKPSVTTDETPELSDSPACKNVLFAPSDATASRDMSTGIVACPARDGDPLADFYVSRAEQCSGRGAGRGHRPLQSATCGSDADCPEGTTCGALGGCYEPPACDEDTPCGDGSICLCASQYAVDDGAFSSAVPFNQCVPSQCHSDDDCKGYSCSLSVEQCSGRVDGIFCHSERDECTQHSDCGDAERVCAYDGSAARWHCEQLVRMCGEF
jgi:hypothetical protein